MDEGLEAGIVADGVEHLAELFQGTEGEVNEQALMASQLASPASAAQPFLTHLVAQQSGYGECLIEQLDGMHPSFSISPVSVATVTRP